MPLDTLLIVPRMMRAAMDEVCHWLSLSWVELEWFDHPGMDSAIPSAIEPNHIDLRLREFYIPYATS